MKPKTGNKPKGEDVSDKIIIKPSKPAIGHKLRVEHKIHRHSADRRNATRQRRNDKAIEEG